MQKIGLDLDNTIIIYDKLFKKLAVEKNLVPNNIKPLKTNIRNFLKEKGQENEFTILQSIVYGERISEAELAQGIQDFLKEKSKKFEFFIISHKTKYPIKGEKYNLREAARSFLREKKIIGLKNFQIKEDNLYFENTIDDKLKRIEMIGCNYFIDDLPKILQGVNSRIIKILYDPNKIYDSENRFLKFSNWGKFSI